MSPFICCLSVQRSSLSLMQSLGSREATARLSHHRRRAGEQSVSSIYLLDTIQTSPSHTTALEIVPHGRSSRLHPRPLPDLLRKLYQSLIHCIYVRCLNLKQLLRQQIAKIMSNDSEASKTQDTDEDIEVHPSNTRKSRMTGDSIDRNALRDVKDSHESAIQVDDQAIRLLFAHGLIRCDRHFETICKTRSHDDRKLWLHVSNRTRRGLSILIPWMTSIASIDCQIH